MASSPLLSSNVATIRSRPRLTGWDTNVPPLLRPLIRAYFLGYAFSVGPRLLALVLHHTLTLGRKRPGGDDGNAQKNPKLPFVEAMRKTLLAGLEWQRFPSFCAALVGGSTLLQPILYKAISRVLEDLSDKSRTRLSRWFSSFIAAWFSLQMLQSKQSIPSSTTLATTSPPRLAPKSDQPPKPQTGRTLDLTLFAATRALDVVIGELWSRRRRRHPAARTATKTLDLLASRLADPLIFATSSALVMWSWVYSPSSLPRAYNKWIASAASIDQRLVVALQQVRDNTIRYGEEGHARLLRGMCEDYNWPVEWGDPAVSIPFPCDMVHMGAGPSCELHALTRLGSAWLWSMKTYLPLQLAVLLVRARSSVNLRRDLVRALLSASRSSAFLGTFITLFYYGVCLARTRLGPHLLGKDVSARQKIDGGVCVGTGCFLSGWSILLEPPGRRKELALFVAPRAVATMLPRRYDADKQWRETLVFASSIAVVFTCTLENERRVRGILGGVLRMVLAA